MSEHLDKAKSAIAAARELVTSAESREDTYHDGHAMTPVEEAAVNRLVKIADVNASIAQAEALESIAASLRAAAVRERASA